MIAATKQIDFHQIRFGAQHLILFLKIKLLSRAPILVAWAEHFNHSDYPVP